MWMGGNPPLGYDLPSSGSHELTVNEAEAETVRLIFRTYLRLNSVHALLRQLETQGIRSKARTTRSGKSIGGQSFSRGALYHLLRNRVYLGEVPHRDQSYPGLHAAILDAGLFETVQARLDANAKRRKATGDKVARSALTGRIFDADDQPMSPTFAYGRNGRLYRYYVSAALQQGVIRAPENDAPRRISAATLENRLLKTLTRVLPTPPADPLARVHRVEVHAGSVHMLLPLKFFSKIKDRLEAGMLAEPDPVHAGYVRLTLPWRLQLRGGRTEILAGAKNTPQPDPVLIRALRTAHGMLERDIKKAPILQTAPTTPWRRRLVRLAFLAPDIQKAILEGRQPDDLTLARLMKAEIPLLWSEQRRIFCARTLA
jgi:hypothetical protein